MRAVRIKRVSCSARPTPWVRVPSSHVEIRLGAINPLDTNSAAPPIEAVPGAVKLRCSPLLPAGSSACDAATDELGHRTSPVEVRLVDPWLNAWSLLGTPVCSVTTTEHISASVDGWTDSTHLRVLVSDRRDPNAPPINQVPKRYYPLDELATVSCTFGPQPITMSIPVTID
jgi:hypothetical protein